MSKSTTADEKQVGKEQADVVINFSILVFILAVQVLLNVAAHALQKTNLQQGNGAGNISFPDITVMILSESCETPSEKFIHTQQSWENDGRPHGYAEVIQFHLSGKTVDLGGSSIYCGYSLQNLDALKKFSFTLKAKGNLVLLFFYNTKRVKLPYYINYSGLDNEVIEITKDVLRDEWLPSGNKL